MQRFGNLFKYLKLVADVDYNGVAHRRNIHPFTILEELETADLVILEQQDDAAGIGVCPEALDQFWTRAWRVIADFGAKGWSFGAIEGFLQIAFL